VALGREKVDNIGCYFGWVNRQTPNDAMASILIRSLHLISCLLEAEIHIEHLPRMSTWTARMVDRMSRRETTSRGDQRLLDEHKGREIPACLLEWLENPVEDWDLCDKLLQHVKDKIEL
jgi:hypothetical protein